MVWKFYKCIFICLEVKLVYFTGVSLIGYILSQKVFVEEFQG